MRKGKKAIFVYIREETLEKAKRLSQSFNLSLSRFVELAIEKTIFEAESRGEISLPLPPAKNEVPDP